jgi:hypothetical protein
MAATDNTPDRDPQVHLFGDHNPQRVLAACDRFLARLATERTTRTDAQSEGSR